MAMWRLMNVAWASACESCVLRGPGSNPRARARGRHNQTGSVGVKFMASDEWRDIAPPRSLSDLERAMLAVLLAQPFPGSEALRRQARIARVNAECTCGCGSIAFVFDRDSP